MLPFGNHCKDWTFNLYTFFFFGQTTQVLTSSTDIPMDRKHISNSFAISMGGDVSSVVSVSASISRDFPVDFVHLHECLHTIL